MRNTKHITTGAITIGLTSILILLDRVSAGLFMSFLALPLVIYGFYFPFKAAITVYFSCVLMSFVLTGHLPLIITIAGYGLVGLSLIYSRNKRLKSSQTYLLMYVTSIPVYFIMVTFFGEYFGVSINETVHAITEMMPTIADENSIRIAAYLSLALMPLIEAYILKVSSTLVLKGLTQSNKYKSNGKTL